jgi:hypothetical protein
MTQTTEEDKMADIRVDGETNLWDETLATLDYFRRRPNEILWVGGKTWSCSFVEFSRFASEVNYDSGFGLHRIASDLVIVGEDWWLERAEYDGSEWWRYCIKPERRSIAPLKSAKQLFESYTDDEENVA